MNKETTFRSLNVSKEVIQALEEMGYERPLSIQSAVIPLLLEGKDITAQSQTGTGKTAAFGIPMAEFIDPAEKTIQGLVLVPTRELALQVNMELHKICKYKKIKDIPVYGGQDIERQIKSLQQGVHIIVGTPCRILDHIRRGTMDLSEVKMVVLDEADEILDMGFIDDIKAILSETSTERQTLLFSATMPDEIKNLAKRYMKEPEHISITPHQITVKLIDQCYYEVKDRSRFDSLCRIMETEKIGSGLIFCRTRRSVDELVDGLQVIGYSVEGLHGDMNQNQRQKVLAKFKEGKIDFMVATDVAARGLHVESVTHVINFNIPEDPDAYVHRIGRTGRAGREGTALTLVTAKEFRMLNQIEKFTKGKIKRRDIPSIEDVIEQKNEKFKTKIIDSINEGSFRQYKHFILELSEEYDLVDIASAAFKLFAEKEQIKILKEEKRFDGHDESFDRKAKKKRGVKDDFHSERKSYEKKRDADNQERIPLFEEKGRKEKFPRENKSNTRFHLNVGKKEKVKPKDLLKVITQKTRLPESAIGQIDIYNSFTFFEVKKEFTEVILRTIGKGTIFGKKVNIEIAKPIQN